MNTPAAVHCCLSHELPVTCECGTEPCAADRTETDDCTTPEAAGALPSPTTCPAGQHPTDSCSVGLTEVRDKPALPSGRRLVLLHVVLWLHRVRATLHRLMRGEAEMNRMGWVVWALCGCSSGGSSIGSCPDASLSDVPWYPDAIDDAELGPDADTTGCEGPNPEGCLRHGCPEGQLCVSREGACLASSCECSGLPGERAWTCTGDCTGGACEPAGPCQRHEDCPAGAALCMEGVCTPCPDASRCPELGCVPLTVNGCVTCGCPGPRPIAD